MMDIRRLQVPIALTLLVATGLAWVPAQGADEVVVREKRTITLCGDLFDIDANADKRSAGDRAKIVQKNLDSALIKTADRTPAAVQVRIVNRHPVVELGGFHIVTADANSAKRNNMTMMELAEMWAESIRHCLADEKSVSTYMSLLTTKDTAKTALVEFDKHVLVMPSNMKLPIKLVSDFQFDGATVGDSITAALSRDFALGPDYKTYLPKGTLVHGKVVDASIYTYNKYPNKDAVTIDFYSLEAPDGQEIPINAHIFGQTNQFFEANARELPNTLPVGNEEVAYVKGSDKNADRRWIVEEPQADPQGLLSAATGNTAVKGLITGTWVDQPMTKRDQHYHTSRLLMNKGSVFSIPQGTELELETDSTTTIAVAAPIGTL